MLRFGQTKEVEIELYGAKETITIFNVDFDNIVISKLVETKSNSQYLTGYLDEVIIPLVLTLPKMSAYVKTFKFKDSDQNQN